MLKIESLSGHKRIQQDNMQSILYSLQMNTPSM